MNNGEVIVLVALHIQKAFDTVDHKILIDKLNYYGICEPWFKSYISGLRQFTIVDGLVSDPLSITTGVPQGSILGPLLFIMYLKDRIYLHLEINATLTIANMYADDTAFFTSSSNLNVINVNLQDDLESVSTWLNVNKISPSYWKNGMHVCLFQVETSTYS